MTVQRQYTLPYCNLILEGIEAVATDPYSPMTVLMNAECQFPGVTDTSLTGGREFLDSLVAAVSAYGQHLLSGIPRPASPTPPLVDIRPGEGDKSQFHHLLVRQQSPGEPTADSEALAPLDIRLTTVQFYDLMEAVDQLLADSQTLPDLTAQFQAISRRLVKPAEPIAQRSAPAVLGAAALAAASLALFFVPPPEFDPTQIERRGTTESVTPGNSDSTAANDDSLEPWQEAPAITDVVVLARLRRDLQQQLQQDWVADPRPSEDWVYRLVVSETGDILGYKYENDLALEAVASTPLAQVTVPAPETSASQQAVAQFLARFTPAGQVEVDDWEPSAATADDRPAPEADLADGEEADSNPEEADLLDQQEDPQAADGADGNEDNLSATDSTQPADDTALEPARSPSATRDPQTLETLENKITDGDRIRTLNQDLRAQLSEADLPSTRADLIYQVRLDSRGNVVGYEAINTDALLLAPDTPLPDLVSSSATRDDQADFRVVFTADGVIQVSPWDGWPQ